MAERIREYFIRFKVGTITTEEYVRAYSEPDAIELLGKKYSEQIDVINIKRVDNMGNS